jgi:hypothetical protein
VTRRSSTQDGRSWGTPHRAAHGEALTTVRRRPEEEDGDARESSTRGIALVGEINSPGDGELDCKRNWGEMEQRR